VLKIVGNQINGIGFPFRCVGDPALIAGDRFEAFFYGVKSCRNIFHVRTCLTPVAAAAPLGPLVLRAAALTTVLVATPQVTGT
jgi:hypothetical protein